MVPTQKVAQAKKDDQATAPAQDPNTGRSRCKVYSRVVGFIRPVDNWNDSKSCEFRHRQAFCEDIAEKRAEELPV